MGAPPGHNAPSDGGGEMRWFGLLLWLAACGGHASDIAVDTSDPGDAATDPGSDTDPDTSTGEVDPGTGSGTDLGTDPDPGTDPPPVSGQACYLGPTRAGVCLPVVQPAVLPAGYGYPPPLGGSPQYREPIAWLDLTALDPAQKLAPNFALSETAEAYKGRYAVVQPHAIERLQELRDELGPLNVNSGYRSPDYNAGVGGASSSRHQWGDAFDISPVSVDLAALADACTAGGAGYVSIYVVHVHCDWRDDAVDPVFFGVSARSAWLDPAPWVSAELVADGAAWTAPALGFDEGEPLREWSAWSADGTLLALHTGSSFEPPADAAWVEVLVGGQLRERAAITGAF